MSSKISLKAKTKKGKRKSSEANRRKDPSIETRIQEQLSISRKARALLACPRTHHSLRICDVLASIKAASGKGSDASNVYDEELPLEEQEFSDDEEEQAAKAAKSGQEEEEGLRR